MASDDANPDLESFRQQWLSDLRSRDAAAPPPPHTTSSSTATRTRSPVSRRHRPSNSVIKGVVGDDDGDDYVPTQSFDGASKQLSRTIADDGGPSEQKQLVSALDHYEEAMEKEAQGNMGDSLHLYRRAYRMDQGVDRRYREKYFPTSYHNKTKSHATSAATIETFPSTSLASTNTGELPADASAQQLPIGELIASFSTLQIEPLAPDVEGTEPPPCPIASLPDELLIHVLEEIAVSDVADFARLSLVCKRFAYLVSHEQRVWRRVCIETEFGFPGMHHHWQRTIEWMPLEDDLIQVADEVSPTEDQSSPVFISRDEMNRRHDGEKLALTLSLVPSTFPSWRAMFRSRPRIRFNGCYISTVNYVRTGVLSTNQATWGGAPIHIVTYYRYLRFFRDGTCISLLTTSEPADVVHSLTRELLQMHRDTSASSHLPSATMKHGHRGRWRLSSLLVDESDDGSSVNPEDAERDLFIETEGVGPKYMYRMDLSLRSAGKGARNNKLVWKGFYSYNKLTDDWGEFQLKNDKPFCFSRVKRYGLGE